MKKIEEAAREFALQYVAEDSSRFHSLCLAFRGGARHVLDAMPDDGVRHAAIAAYGDFDDGETDEMKWDRVLTAVRKEIEG